jgi:hypothetical protein
MMQEQMKPLAMSLEAELQSVRKHLQQPEVKLLPEQKQQVVQLKTPQLKQVTRPQNEWLLWVLHLQVEQEK